MTTKSYQSDLISRYDDSNCRDEILNEIKKCTRLHAKKLPIPDIIHFIWIGNGYENYLDYIKIWALTNPNKKIVFWYDSECMSVKYYHDKIRKITRYKYEIGQCFSYEDSLIETQNISYKKLMKYIKNDGMSFDESCGSVLFDILPNDSNINLDYEFTFSNFSTNSYFEFRDVRDVLNDDKIKYIYELELYLRGNIAAASDILRYFILYIFGGVYVDVDTLPEIKIGHIKNEIETIFPIELLEALILDETLKKYLKHIGCKESISIVNSSDVFDKIKSFDKNEYFKIRLIVSDKISLSNIEDVWVELDYNLKCYENTALFSVDDNYKNALFTNIIATHKESKVFSIILKEIVKRYSYIDRKGFLILENTQIPREKNYYDRLLSYRLDEFKKNNFVTIILTGPGMISEIVTAIFYEIFKLDYSVRISTVNSLLCDVDIGIGFRSQSINTPKSLESTWMINCDG